jgi:hypothetical protein
MLGRTEAAVPPHQASGRPRVTVMTELDSDGFFTLLSNGLARLP